MTIKKRGLGRGLEALLVDVSTHEDKQIPINKNTHINKPFVNNKVLLDSANKQFTSSNMNQIAEQNKYMNFNNALSNQDVDPVLNVSELLQEAENLKALLIEFEEMLLNR